MIFVVFVQVLLFLGAVLTVALNIRNPNPNETSELGDEEGGFHCFTGVFGVLLITASIGAGFLISGRFGCIRGFPALPIHRYAALIMSTFLTGQFTYGLAVGNYNFTDSTHGILGFLIPVLAWLTTGLSPCFAGKRIKWKAASRVHATFAIILFVLTTVQVFYAFSVLGD